MTELLRSIENGKLSSSQIIFALLTATMIRQGWPSAN